VFTVGHAGAESFDDASIATAELDGSAHRLIVHHAADGRYVDTGHLVWARGGALFAACFDLARRLVHAAARPVQSGVAMAATGVAHCGVASTGMLVHVPGEAQTLRRSLVLVDRQGAVKAELVQGDTLEEPRVASDGSAVIVSLRKRQSNLWLYDFARGALARATFEGENFAGIWGPDAGWLTFSSSRGRGPSDLYIVRPDRPAPPELLVGSEFDKVAGVWTPDGSGLLFTEYHPDSGADVWILDRPATRAREFVRTPFNEYGPVCSPDGRHVAYTTDESGHPEIHVVSYPDATGKRQVSTDGGAEAMWSPDGTELFYRCADRLMRVDMSRGPHRAGIPTTLFEGKYVGGTVTLANYDVMPDGAHFLMTRADLLPPPSALMVTLHWVQELSG
jgi:Tol biopolymer transport system component